jgi:tryptophan-rich sensory protein
VWVVICEAVGIVGSVFTVSNIPTWYATLVKPELAPPNWIFGPVWTTLYMLMGVAAWLVWRTRGDTRQALTIFGIQLALNLAWSWLFFGLQSPLLGLWCIGAMWLAIVATIVVFYRHSRVAAYLLVPYLAWVSFASYLNYMLFALN